MNPRKPRLHGGGLRPRKMKQIDFTVLARDVDKVIEFLGRRAVIQFAEENESTRETGSRGEINEDACIHIRDNMEKLRNAAEYLGLPCPVEPEENSLIPGDAEEALTQKICDEVSSLNSREKKQKQERGRIEESLTEAAAFASLNAPFNDLDQLSYVTLRIGRLDSTRHNEVREALTDRAVIIPLDGEDKILAAASRKGRFALDSELKKAEFIPIAIPEGYTGVPSELLSGLEQKLKTVNMELEEIESSKKKLMAEYNAVLYSLCSSYRMAEIIEQLKARLVSTKNAYFLTGWVPADALRYLVEDLEKLTCNRIAIRAFNPEEIPNVRDGKEKVPVSLNHGAFVNGFEGMVFSYGVPLYGTIDPTPFVALFFTLLFGIMFGDAGQGLVLFIAGVLTGKRGLKVLSGFKKFSVPLRAAGIASIIMGLLTGEVFANDKILAGPTLALTGFLTGQPVERILTLMPLPEHGGSVVKLFYFFGFTLCIGIILNSIGLVFNLINLFSAKNYEKAIFSKTGLAGTIFFWYAIFIAARFILSLTDNAVFSLFWFDIAGLAIPVFAIFFGHALWSSFSGIRPVFKDGFMVFLIEGLVEIMETVSTYFSNTVSFLRVGAFALSHAVLSFVVFFFAEMVSHAAGGIVFSFIIMIFGNLIIIMLEGLIVAIQVVRLQYYEFFSKFFTETGVEFSPFRFRKGANL